MANLPFFTSISIRQVNGAPPVLVKNRFAETDQILNDSPASLIARPGMKKFIEVGTGHIRKVFSQPGVFNDDLFVVSGQHLWRVTSAGVKTDLGAISADITSGVSMCATAPIENSVPAYLFIAEGGVLSVWTDNGQAIGQLSASGSIADNDTVQIDTMYYKWVSGSVDTGTPDGTSGNPWLVNRGGSNAVALTNLFNAINANEGIAGTDYSTATDANPSVIGYNVSSTTLYVCAIEPGTVGNAIVTTETGANISWVAGTLQNGGSALLRQIHVPSDAGAVSIAVINGYVIVVPNQTTDIKGRFFFIQPGEIKIDPLDFATAERSPDGIHQVVVFGEMFWLLGQDTTEPWITTGDQAAPVSRFQGVLYDRGTWSGSAVQVKDSLILVDQNGGVFQVASGATRISTPDIEEPIRRALQKEALLSSFS